MTSWRHKGPRMRAEYRGKASNWLGTRTCYLGMPAAVDFGQMAEECDYEHDGMVRVTVGHPGMCMRWPDGRLTHANGHALLPGNATWADLAAALHDCWRHTQIGVAR
jgi:hypothetical protein